MRLQRRIIYTLLLVLLVFLLCWLPFVFLIVLATGDTSVNEMPPRTRCGRLLVWIFQLFHKPDHLCLEK